LKIRENNSVDLASNVNQPVSTGVAKRKDERGHMKPADIRKVSDFLPASSI
jgi:hypothetical protein